MWETLHPLDLLETSLSEHLLLDRLIDMLRVLHQTRSITQISRVSSKSLDTIHRVSLIQLQLWVWVSNQLLKHRVTSKFQFPQHISSYQFHYHAHKWQTSMGHARVFLHIQYEFLGNLHQTVLLLSKWMVFHHKSDLPHPQIMLNSFHSQLTITSSTTQTTPLPTF